MATSGVGICYDKILDRPDLVLLGVTENMCFHAIHNIGLVIHPLGSTYVEGVTAILPTTGHYREPYGHPDVSICREYAVLCLQITRSFVTTCLC